MRISVRAALAALCLAAALAVIVPGAGAAEPVAAPHGDALAPEVARLREQIDQLRQALERLDRRLEQIQRAGASGNAPAGAAVSALPQAGAPMPAAQAAAAAPQAAPAAPPALAPAPAAAALDSHQQAVLQEQVRTADALAAWQGLRNGMRQEEVRRLLGEPQSTLAVGNRTGWIYTYRNAGKGSVFFGSDGTVVSLMSPAQGALHLY